MPTTLTGLFDLVMVQFELGTSRLVELQGEKNKAVDHVSELECEQVKLNAKVLYSKEQVGIIRADKEFTSAGIFAVGTHCNKLNDELNRQCMELERLRVILSAKPDSAELVEPRMTLKEASFVQERK